MGSEDYFSAEEARIRNSGEGPSSSGLDVRPSIEERNDVSDSG
jgi:hypothetical protein